MHHVHLLRLKLLGFLLLDGNGALLTEMLRDSYQGEFNDGINEALARDTSLEAVPVVRAVQTLGGRLQKT